MYVAKMLAFPSGELRAVSNALPQNHFLYVSTLLYTNVHPIVGP